MKKTIAIFFILFSFSVYSYDIDELIKKANNGDAEAQNKLGKIYSDGNSTITDYEKAINYYKLSAEQGNLYAQHNLGVMYYFGQGVPKNLSIAKEWFKKSCDQKFVIACGYYKKLNKFN